MIATDYTGRLGNQLFTYAFTRIMMEKQKDKQLIANFKRSETGDAKDGYEDALQYFNVQPYSKDAEDLVLKHGSMLQRMFYLFYVLCTRIPVIGRNDYIMIHIDRLARILGLLFSGAADKAWPQQTIRKKNVFVRGYFADKDFFDDIRPILLKELTPKEAPLKNNRILYEAASLRNSVCISVRRGDYLSKLYKKNFFLCDEAYFRKAVSIIRERVDNPVLIFFSDDIQWVREHLYFEDLQCFYETGNDPIWEKLRLMYSCHHFIISNSTFSWWAQYLGRRDDKIVISPSRWFANPEWTSHLVDKEFIIVDC